MAVTPHPKDNAGTQKQAQITSLLASTVTSSLSKARVDADLLAARIELVNHYMAIGRLDPATILSTLS